VSFAENWQRFLPEAPVITEVTAPEDGFILGWDSRVLGEMVVDLGGGRRVETDLINPSVGLDQVLPIGSQVAKGQAVARIHAARIETAQSAKTAVIAAMTLGKTKPKVRPIVLKRVH
jgi:thymidine phosphorylase